MNYIQKRQAKMNNREIVDGGLLVNVYRSTGMDCTVNGVTSYEDSFYIFNAATLENDEGVRDGYVHLESVIHSDSLDRVLVLVDSAGNSGKIHAVPYLEWLSGRWTMMGGNFVYTSDSRFPAYPVPVHDRVENG